MSVICSSAWKRVLYQTFHSSKEMLIRFVRPSSARTVSAVATTDSMKWSMFVAHGEEAGGVAVALLVVGVAGDVVDVVVGVAQDGVLPRPEGRHLRVRAAADDELEVGVELAHGLGRLRGDLAVVLGVAVAELPGPVHLVAQAPHRDAVRVDAAVLDAGVGERRARADVGVLEDVDGLQHAAGAEVDRVHQLAADLLQPAGELVEARPRCSRSSARRGRAASGARRAGRPSPPSGSRRRSCRRGSGWSTRRARGRAP